MNYALMKSFFDLYFLSSNVHAFGCNSSLYNYFFSYNKLIKSKPQETIVQQMKYITFKISTQT